MVLGVPFFKLAPLAFKVITKPFVDILKKNVRKSDFWKNIIFIPMARSKYCYVDCVKFAWKAIFVLPINLLQMNFFNLQIIRILIDHLVKS